MYILTTNQIESSFATILHRTTRTKDCVSRNTLLGLIFQTALTAVQSLRKLRGLLILPDVAAGVRFEDGLRVMPEHEPTEQEKQQFAA